MVVVKRAFYWDRQQEHQKSPIIFFGGVSGLDLSTLVITVELGCLLMSIRLLVSRSQQDEDWNRERERVI